jgi:hypothetical protein
VVSAYELAARQPSLPTLARLVAATGTKLRVEVARSPAAAAPAWTPRSSAATRSRRGCVRSPAATGLPLRESSAVLLGRR